MAPLASPVPTPMYILYSVHVLQSVHSKLMLLCTCESCQVLDDRLYIIVHPRDRVFFRDKSPVIMV